MIRRPVVVLWLIAASQWVAAQTPSAPQSELDRVGALRLDAGLAYQRWLAVASEVAIERMRVTDPCSPRIRSGIQRASAAEVEFYDAQRRYVQVWSGYAREQISSERTSSERAALKAEAERELRGLEDLLNGLAQPSAAVDKRGTDKRKLDLEARISSVRVELDSLAGPGAGGDEFVLQLQKVEVQIIDQHGYWLAYYESAERAYAIRCPSSSTSVRTSSPGFHLPGFGPPINKVPGGAVTPPEPPGAPATPREVRRYPTIEAPPRIAPAIEFSVQVSLTVDQQTPEVTVSETGKGTTKGLGGLLRMTLPCVPECAIEVVLNAPGFDIVSGSNTAQIQMNAGRSSTVARFKLKSMSEAPAGPSRISATYWYGGTYLARAVRGIVVAAPAAETPPAVARAAGVAPGGAAMGASAPMAASILDPPPIRATVIPRTVAAPDLTIRWEESQVGDRTSCQVTVAAPRLGPTLSEACRPGRELAGLVSMRYGRLLEIRGARPVGAGGMAADVRTAELDEIKGFGQELYAQMPALVRDTFWKLVDDEQTVPDFHFRSIQIYTNDFVLPWELLVPVRRREPFRGFLGTEFQIARWHIDDHVEDAPPLSVFLRTLAAIAPRYEGGKFLANQKREMDFIKQMPGFREVRGTLRDVGALLDHPPEGMVHFAGHGQAEQQAGELYKYRIQLEDSTIDPTGWRAHSSSAGPHPLYFFNACDTGKGARPAGFLDGWAGAILQSGASGFIGGLWPLSDSGAADFSRLFYGELRDALAQKEPGLVSEMLRKARRRFLETGDPTFMAYAFYGDTRLRIVGPSVR